MDTRSFFERGWVRFPFDPEIATWVGAARAPAVQTLDDPELRRLWLRCGGTWFAGVNALPNTADGALPEHAVPPLGGRAIEFIARHLGLVRIRMGQGAGLDLFSRLSATLRRGKRGRIWFSIAPRRCACRRVAPVRSGPPKNTQRNPWVHPWPSADRCTRQRCADGGLRRLATKSCAGRFQNAWRVSRRGTGRRKMWTEAYVSARRQCFERCPRVTIPARLGEVYLVHRLCLHGVAPWPVGAADGSSRGHARDCLFQARSFPRCRSVVVACRSLSGERDQSFPRLD